MKEGSRARSMRWRARTRSAWSTSIGSWWPSGFPPRRSLTVSRTPRRFARRTCRTSARERHRYADRHDREVLRFDSETGVPQYDPDEGGIFVTGQVQRESGGTAWEPRLKVVEMGLHSPQRAAIEIYRLS